MKQLEMRMITLQWKDKHERKQEQRDSHGEVVRARRWWKGTAQTRNQKRENANTNKMERKSKEWKGLKETDWQTNRQTVRHTTSSASFLPSRNKSKWSCLHFSFHVDICFVSFFLSFQNKEKGHIEEERERLNERKSKIGALHPSCSSHNESNRTFAPWTPLRQKHSLTWERAPTESASSNNQPDRHTEKKNKNKAEQHETTRKRRKEGKSSRQERKRRRR